ncbi:hypothetical protein COEREDRAFT_9936 [Coemansia reversa NRRL 1564]|uniref:Uncharacterized protein n=1 Tax=Coemansia reversa (strain ATCC 12441 / NRRL 1564) TaxID=763665 RepID=A0A2G5B7A8_COERN|nr:hypothetical protein COEREDRAFT_9936 [Coemansia reversa NRRL 1564]|eukprot:PIA14862.1 hypothetical protein COEREDRAFT_9936 [Coemansia reversa NRRL 1564]
MRKKQANAIPLNDGSSYETELSSSQIATTEPSIRDSDSSFAHNYRMDLDLRFDSSTNTSLGHALPPAGCPTMSLEDLEERLLHLQSQVADTHAMIARYSRSSDPGSSSAEDTQSNDGRVCCYDVSRPVPENALAEWRFDICRGVRRNSPKPVVLLRRHNTGARLLRSPLFDLSRPAMVHELLNKHAHDEPPVGPFMERHKSMAPFMPYVIQDAHLMPKFPQNAPVNDQATQHLPPLAAEEYAVQISRLSYLARSLHAIEAADPDFLSHTRVHLLLDLIMDLEQTFTLPRIDFLRRHAETIQAMGPHRAAPDTWDTDCIVGSTENNRPPLSLSSPTSPNSRHIKYMTLAIPRHPRFRRVSATDTHATNSQISSDHATSILGTKLHPDACATSPMNECRDKFGVLSSPRSPSPDSVLHSMLALRQFDSAAHMHLRQQSQQPVAYVADASAFDSKLYPVVGPRSLDVSPTLQITNDGLSLAGFARRRGNGPSSLRCRPQPGPELSPTNSGEF